MGRGVTPSNGVFPSMRDMLRSRGGPVARGALQRNNKALLAKAQREANEATEKRSAQAREGGTEKKGTVGEGCGQKLRSTLRPFTKTLDSYSLMQSQDSAWNLSEYLANVNPNDKAASQENKPPVVTVNLLR